MKTIAINADLGEGTGNDAQLMPLLYACSIACGGHYGDKKTMYDTMQLAKKYQVKIGAHPSFPDQENFGRKNMDLTESVLQSIAKQWLDFRSVAANLDISIHHFKPHGALYNLIARDETAAKTFALFFKKQKITAPLLCPPQSAIDKACNTLAIETLSEGFLDRNYTNEGNLQSRTLPNALIETPEEVLAQVLRLAQGIIKTIDGSILKRQFDTFCIHGDHPASVHILTFLNQELPKHGYKIRK